MVRSKRSGFTLIEIILVLAIAGLILTMVFMALPATERSRRDSQRKNDLGRLQTQVTFYGSNHSGTYPSNLSTDPDFWNSGTPGSYVPANFNDPSSNTSYFSIPSGTPGAITYSVGAGTACNGTTMLTSVRQFVLRMQLESGTACLDSLE